MVLYRRMLDVIDVVELAASSPRAESLSSAGAFCGLISIAFNQQLEVLKPYLCQLGPVVGRVQVDSVVTTL